MSKFNPTPEQTACVDKFTTGKRLRINAYAGTGKTSTLTLLAKATPRAGTYMAFNKAIADDAKKKFPSSVACSTTHSLAFRSKVKSKQNPRGFEPDKMSGSVNGGFLAARLRLPKIDITTDVTLTARGFGFLILETIRRWQRSGRDEIGIRDVVLEGKLALLEPRHTDPLRQRIEREARKLWLRMADPTDDMPLGHGGYLKLWALDRPAIPGDYLLLDEAQDTNGVVLELMRHQKAQVIAVGDRHQQIYEWRGAQNAMVELPADVEARLSTSFRFGPAIAGYASEVLALLGENVPLKGNPALSDRLGNIDEPDAILARTNGRLLDELLAALERGKRPYVVGGVKEMLTYVEAAAKLQANIPVEYPLDFFGFVNWREVQEAAEKPEGAELRRWVRPIDMYGCERLTRALESLPKQEAGANLVLSTGHKSKGREWAKVRVLDDFLRGVRTDADDKAKAEIEEVAAPEEELRLYYVAVTRGQQQIEIPAGLALKMAVLQKAAASRAAAE